MEIIPVIDIIKGKCVRLTKGDYSLKKIYSANPVKEARSFEKAGLKRLHLIDLDGARAGKIKNWEILRKIIKKTNLLIEFGGGIRNREDVRRLLGLGIDRVIVGSLILKEPKRFQELVREFGEKIVAAVDVKKGKICCQGWQEKSSRKVFSFLREVSELGIETIICTDIERDGMLEGPNLKLYKKIVAEFPRIKIIASGGVRNIKDLETLSRIGLAGAIVGKAIYEKRIKISDLKKIK